MEASNPSETLVMYDITQRYVVEGDQLNIQPWTSEMNSTTDN
jgi:hypothetical protein